MTNLTPVEALRRLIKNYPKPSRVRSAYELGFWAAFSCAAMVYFHLYWISLVFLLAMACMWWLELRLDYLLEENARLDMIIQQQNVEEAELKRQLWVKRNGR